MTKNEVINELRSGKKLEDLFEFTDGQECLIYKADEFEVSDNVIYIPDIFLNEIAIDRVLTNDEIQDVRQEMYTGNDFLEECNNKEDAARLLFSWCDWQHPTIHDIEQELNENGNVLYQMNNYSDVIKITGVIIKHGKNDYGLWEGFNLSEEDENIIQQILIKYDTEGYSVRGTREEIAREMEV